MFLDQGTVFVPKRDHAGTHPPNRRRTVCTGRVRQPVIDIFEGWGNFPEELRDEKEQSVTALDFFTDELNSLWKLFLVEINVEKGHIPDVN